MTRRHDHPRTAACRLEPLEPRQLLAAGALDKSFSGDGKATITFNSFDLQANDVAVQADGKTVIVGTARRSASPPNPFFALARLNLDGTPDTTFGVNNIGSPSGIAFSTFRGNREHFARAVAIQPDGKIVLAGELGDDWAVARYLSNGTLDLSFDGDGVQTIGFNSVVRDIAVQSDGKIVVVGTHFDGIILLNGNMAIARLNPNGSFDNSFDGDGKKQIQFGDDDDAHAVAFDGAGKIILAGESGPGMALTRLNRSDGSVDTTFGINGLVRTRFPGRGASVADSVLVQSSGKIVVAGRTQIEPVLTPNGDDFLVGRYLSTGQLDTTFGAAHTGLVELGFGGRDRAFGVVQSANGGLVIGGTNSLSGSANVRLVLAGLTANGLIDNNFGTLGKVVTNFGPAGAGGGVNGGIAKGPGRRFVVAGSNFNAARYLDTGANVVSAGSFDPNSTEGTGDTASFIVGRTERLPVPTRVFFSIGGTAAKHSFLNIIGGVLARPGDYALSGMSVSPSPAGNFVDIPANQTFVTVTVTPTNDSTVEGLETATFSIVPSASYEIGTPASAKINIVDDDGAILSATADAFARDGTSAGTNFGSSTELQVKTASTGLNRQSFFKFDLFGVSAINSAKLRLFGRISDTQNTNLATRLFSVANTSWTEGGITFNNKPAPGATALATATIIDNTARFYEFDVTAYAKAEKAAGRNIVSFALTNPATSASFLTFNSREAGSNGAQLIISGISAANVGTSVLTPGVVHLPKNSKVTYKLQWTHPGVWRDLDTIELRIVNGAGVLAWIRWDETTNALSLGDPKTGQFSRSGQPGSRRKLKAGNVVLDLRHSSVVGTGPQGPSVTLTLALKLNVKKSHGSNAPLNYRVEVFASDDNGNRQGFDQAGTLRLL